MKNNQAILKKFLTQFSTRSVDTIVWYFKDNQVMYSEDISRNYNGQIKFFDHKSRKFFNAEQFVKHIGL